MSGFEGLMAALFGETPEAQAAAPLPTKVFKAPGDGELDPEGQTLQPEGTDQDDILAAAALLPPPAPVMAPPVQAPSADPAKTSVDITSGVQSPSADVGAPVEVKVDVQTGGEIKIEARASSATAEAVPDGPESPIETQSIKPPPLAEGRQGPTEPPRATAGAPHNLTTGQTEPQNQASNGVAPPPRPDGPPAPPAAQTAPTPAQTVQAAAQPLMTAAAAAGVVSLRASQSGAPVEAVVESGAEETDTAPVKPTASAKAAPQPPAASPFALITDSPGPTAAKPDTFAAAAAMENVPREAVPTEGDIPQTVSLDEPDGLHATTGVQGGQTAETRDASRVVATPATVSDLATQVARKLQGRTTHFDIQLTPEGLGRVDVRVDIDAQGKLTAAMAFDNPHAANEMRGRSGELLKALEQAGFDMSGGLSFNAPQDQRGGGQFADQAPDREAWQGRAFQNALGVADEADTTAIANRLYQQRRSPTGVDLRI
ncbi:MAG: flagellar hook-length control protein FliK [Phenylobacterium sp.]|uniref:flagellar hook-length control protein FliK n=1 Tax=Phenylobacterium sp. TaxID=1871053 RepID=UPI00271A8F61|nr:flagellar hook-length control protein FliK [Phenylobacterium sp.]MDO8900850.1 flagellar hook-length control protein FliK [Phenylobacterium sp.]